MGACFLRVMLNLWRMQSKTSSSIWSDGIDGAQGVENWFWSGSRRKKLIVNGISYFGTVASKPAEWYAYKDTFVGICQKVGHVKNLSPDDSDL